MEFREAVEDVLRPLFPRCTTEATEKPPPSESRAEREKAGSGPETLVNLVPAFSTSTDWAIRKDVRASPASIVLSKSYSGISPAEMEMMD